MSDLQLGSRTLTPCENPPVDTGHHLVTPGGTWKVNCAAFRKVRLPKGDNVTEMDELDLVGTLDEVLDAVCEWAERIALGIHRWRSIRAELAVLEPGETGSGIQVVCRSAEPTDREDIVVLLKDLCGEAERLYGA